MLDFSYIDNNPKYNLQEFRCDNKAVQEFTWIKPKGAKMVFIFAVSPGADGGQGYGGASGAVRWGGGGGGSGALVKQLLPALLLPDNLSVYFGSGALVIKPLKGLSVNTQNIIRIDVLTAAGNATSSANGAGGTGSTLSSSFSNFIPLGIHGSQGGGATGGAGGASGGTTGSTGTNISPFSTSLINGGAGGATIGTNNATINPSQIAGAGIYPQGQTQPSSGFNSWKPFFSIGGTSDYGKDTVGNYKGGNGGIGSGGAGASGYTTGGSSTPGIGGDGYVAIITLL
jgi:hypothetical protein